MLLVKGLVCLIGLFHLYIMIVEMFASAETQAKLFAMDLEYVRQGPAQVALGNQGIYNGFLGLFMILAIFLFHGAAQVTVFSLLLLFVIVVGLYGTLTVTKKIFFVQALPAVVTFVILQLVK